MESSFFEYRDDTTRQSESDSEIIDNSLVAEASFHRMPKSAKKNQTVFVAESEESETDDETESNEDHDDDVLDNSKSIISRSNTSRNHIGGSGDEDGSKPASTGRQSANSFAKALVLSSSSDEEGSPELVPRRRPGPRQKSRDRPSESPLVRRVKRRMILTDSENDNSILLEKEKTKKIVCLKDTPAKTDGDSEKCLPQNVSVMSDEDAESASDGDQVADSDDEANYPDEDEMVMSKATRMSIMGVRPKDLASDESDFIQSSDDSNRLSSALSTHSLDELPDAGVSIHKTPAKSLEHTNDPSYNQASDQDQDDGNLDDSRISCSTFGSPVKDDSFAKDNGTKEPSVKGRSPLKMIQVADVQRKLKAEEDDDVTIIDSIQEIIALSSDDDEKSPRPKKSPQPRKKSPRKSADAPEAVLIESPQPASGPAEAKEPTMRQYLAPESYPAGAVYVKKSVRENELSKLNQLQGDLHNVRNLLDNMDVSTLPDGGVRLIERLSGLEMEVRRQGDKVANMIVEPDHAPGLSADGGLDVKPGPGLTWDDIQKASNQVQPKMFGKQAMSTHMAERNLILERLRDLHESLASRPAETIAAPPPRGLKTPLMPHQLHALAWLKWRETQSPAGGILADDMGLGKTITMIALVVAGKETGINDEDDDDEDEWSGSGKENSRLVRGGTLVVCPASVLQQWAGEVNAHCTPHALSVCLHHGAARAQQPRRLATSDLVVTTYNILQRDTEKNGVLMRIRWTRVILDEAHIVRNHKAATSVAVAALHGARRWCLTGTPVQNKDLDVFALLKFLRCTPFNDLAMWKKWIDNKSMGGQERLSTIMRCLLLRRTKAQLQQRGQLACLPSRELHKIEVTLSKEEMNVYQKVLVFSKTLFAQFLHQRAERQADGALASSQQAYDKMHKRMVQLHGAKPVKSHEILVLLLRLRQVCCHCGLIAAMLDGEDDVSDVTEDPGSVDLLSELNKLSLEDAAERRTSKARADDEEEGPPQEGTTAAEAIRSVLSPNNPVFQLATMSSKIRAVMDCLFTQVLNNPGHKAVVVSQWTAVLRLVDDELRKANVKSVTLSGQVAVTARPPLIQALNNQDSPVRVMLLSLCAGGVGLNLCGANHLLLLDPHWNPQLEEQAQDRIFRVGQKRPVHIYRFMCVETVEQSIRRLQEAKLQLADNVLTGAKHNNASKLSIEDLKMLFNMGPSGQ